MYVVTGVTGNTGSVVANALLDAGKPVRVVVRNPAKAQAFAARGAEVATADFSDPAALSRALRGAQGAYLLSHPDVKTATFIADKERVLRDMARAVKEAGVPHVVFLSSIGAQHAEGTGPIRSLHCGERALTETGLATTFVRAASFAENWASVLPIAQKDGVLPTFFPRTLAVATVATRDIGEVSAQALLDGARGRRIVELAGPVEASAEDVAAALSRVLGRRIDVAEAPLDRVVPTYTSFGISTDVAQLYREMYAGFITGHVAWEGRGAEAARGQTSVENVLRTLLARSPVG